MSYSESRLELVDLEQPVRVHKYIPNDIDRREAQAGDVDCEVRVELGFTFSGSGVRHHEVEKDYCLVGPQTNPGGLWMISIIRAHGVRLSI